MKKPAAIVVGGGVGGLCAAIRLRAAGHAVTLFERNGVVGGKLAVYERDGFVFDIGPSLLTLPHVFDDVFRVAGTSLADEVDLVRLPAPYTYHWSPDARSGGRSAGNTPASLTVHDDGAATAAAFDAFDPGAGAQWRSFIDHGRRIWEVAERTFFAGPMSNPIDLMRRMRSPKDLWAIDPIRTLHGAAAQTFRDPRLAQWAGRYATYSGSSPYAAPATLACIPYIEAEFGCWYVTGGLGALRDALADVATRSGVEIVTGAEVTRITGPPDRATGVQLLDSSVHGAGVVVANIDAGYLYDDVLPDEQAALEVARAAPSTSGFVMCLGVSGTTPGVAHHNVWFSDDYHHEFFQLGNGRLADQPTVYACVSSVTDPTQAPAGAENWFLLVNAPPTAHGADVDRTAYGDVVLDRLEEFGVELRSRASFTWTMTPLDIATRYRAPRGSIYGTSSNGRRAAFVRPRNRGARRGLYLVGGSSHPGGGLPLVAMSGRIVADMVAGDVRRGRLRR